MPKQEMNSSKQQSNFIWVTTQFEGFHKYPNAPLEVSFLKNKHRHLFGVKVWIEVFHNERDIEFILFKRFVESKLNGKCDNRSCEEISDLLHSEIVNKYPNREIRIEINEDKENGSYKEYAKKNNWWNTNNKRSLR